MRLLELRSDLVQWNPPNSFVKIMREGREEAFPNDIVHLDEILVDLKLGPNMLEIPIPKFLKEDIKRQIEDENPLFIL